MVSADEYKKNLRELKELGKEKVFALAEEQNGLHCYLIAKGLCKYCFQYGSIRWCAWEIFGQGCGMQKNFA